MTYKQIEASREARLWITQVIVPLFAVTMLVPELREAVVTKAKEAKDTIKLKLRK